jgi:hypothetical protein
LRDSLHLIEKHIVVPQQPVIPRFEFNHLNGQGFLITHSDHPFLSRITSITSATPSRLLLLKSFISAALIDPQFVLS